MITLLTEYLGMSAEAAWLTKGIILAALSVSVLISLIHSIYSRIKSRK